MNEIVIVAIPAEDDPVWKVSSEKVPHLTLCYLKGPFENEENTIRFVEHAVATSLTRFGMSVDRRGTLGPDDADVLFFDKSYGGRELIKFRAFLLANDDIFTAYKKAEQYPVWTPHLTLGYPATPAKEMPEHGVRWISFDRIAIWTSDFSGPEFELKSGDQMVDLNAAWSFETSSDYFAHKFDPVAEFLDDDEFDDILMHFGFGDIVKKAKSVGSSTREFVRDAKGQFAKVPSNLENQLNVLQFKLANLIGLYDPMFDITLTETPGDGTTIDTRSILLRDSTEIEIIKKKNMAGRVTDTKTIIRDADGKESTPLIDFRKVEKAVKKASVASQRQNFRPTAKLNPSQVIKGTKNTPPLSNREWIELKKNKAQDAILNRRGGGLASSARKYAKKNQVRQDAMGSESLDDILMHFGVRGMRWGVRRSIGPNGLVEGTVAGAIRGGQKPKASDSNPFSKAKKSAGSADHQKMVKNLDKRLEDLDTNEIREISGRIKAIRNLNEATAAQKAAKASLGKKLTKWALTQVKEGARKEGEKWIQDQTGGVVKNVLPDLRPRKMPQTPAKSGSASQTTARPTPGFKTQPVPKTPEREQAVKELAAEITSLAKKEE